jgi:hypothetical protein
MYYLKKIGRDKIEKKTPNRPPLETWIELAFSLDRLNLLYGETENQILAGVTVSSGLVSVDGDRMHWSVDASCCCCWIGDVFIGSRLGV